MLDFMSIDTVYFTKDGLLQKTPAHNYSEFRFRTYAALAFRRFRELFKIETDMYLASLCSGRINNTNVILLGRFSPW